MADKPICSEAPAAAAKDAPAPVPPADLLAEFVREKGLRFNAKYVQECRRQVERLMELLEVEDVRSVTSAHVVDFMERMRLTGWPVQEGKAIQAGRSQRRSHAGRPVGPNTRRIYQVRLETVFGWLKQKEYIKADPTRGLPKPSHEERAMRAWTADEISRLITVAKADEESERPQRPTKRWRHYLFLSITGCTVAMTETLRWKHFDLEAEVPVVTVWRSKTKKEWQIPLDEGTAEIFREWRRERERRDEDGDLEDLVFGPRPNDRCVHRDMEEAGVARRDSRGRAGCWHNFRRHAATELARAGVPVKVAQARLGHKHATTTLRFYDRTDEDQAAQASAAAVLAGGLKDFSRNHASGSGQGTDVRVVSCSQQRQPGSANNIKIQRESRGSPFEDSAGVEVASAASERSRPSSLTS